jgi:hypothetical protein
MRNEFLVDSLEGVEPLLESSTKLGGTSLQAEVTDQEVSVDSDKASMGCMFYLVNSIPESPPQLLRSFDTLRSESHLLPVI